MITTVSTNVPWPQVNGKSREAIKEIASERIRAIRKAFPEVADHGLVIQTFRDDLMEPSWSANIRNIREGVADVYCPLLLLLAPYIEGPAGKRPVTPGEWAAAGDWWKTLPDKAAVSFHEPMRYGAAWTPADMARAIECGRRNHPGLIGIGDGDVWSLPRIFPDFTAPSFCYFEWWTKGRLQDAIDRAIWMRQHAKSAILEFGFEYPVQSDDLRTLLQVSRAEHLVVWEPPSNNWEAAFQTARWAMGADAQ
jgi:hypothetical protein